MALGENLKSTEKTKTKEASKAVSMTAEAMINDLDESIFDKLPLEAQVKIKELNLKNEVLDKSCLISMTDKKGFITYVNDKFCEVAQYTREECLGQNHNMVRHPDMPKAVFKQVWATIGKGEMFVGNIKNRCKDGSHYWVDAYIAPILGANGKPEAYIGIRFDITELMEAKDDGEALKQAIDLSWASIEFETDGTIIRANDNFVSALGYDSADELIGKNHSIFCTKDYAQSDEYSKLWKDLGDGKVHSGEFERVGKNGEEVWLSSSFTPVKDLNGKIVKVVKIAADITDQVTEKRKNSEILEQAVDAVVTINADKTVTFFNKRAEELFGFSRNEVLGKNVKMIVPMDHRANHDSYVNANITTGVNKVIGSGRDLEMTTKDGGKFWGNLSLTRVEVRGELQYTAFIKDITEERAVKLQAESVKIAVDTGSVSAEFDLDGTIISANSNFISIVGHKKESDLVGQHHRVICEKSYVDSQEYAKFWKDLANGDIQSGEYKLIDKGGSDVWVQSAYVPVRNEEGDVYKVIKIATDVTDVKVPILQVKDIISNVAQGDLTQKFDEAASGYVKEMGDALNVALDNLNALLNNIQENSNLLGASSEQMLTKSDQMQGTTQEVASAIGEMAEGTQQQAEQIDQASQLLEGVRNASLEVTDKSQDINKAAEASQGSVGVGLETVKKVVDSMTEIKESAQTTSDSINVLTERSEEIARTLNVITDIAAQTNLLALNAAIEAARAGDAGRGFAVVAEEIRKLAEDSRKSAGNIEKVISAVGKDVASAGKAISTMDSSVKIGNDASGDAEKVFNEISVTTEQTLRLSVEVLASAEVQKQNIDDTVKNIEQIVVVSEETASGTEEIATSSKDLSNGMDEFNSTSKGLAEIATQIQDGVSKFTLRQ